MKFRRNIENIAQMLPEGRRRIQRASTCSQQFPSHPVHSKDSTRPTPRPGYVHRVTCPKKYASRGGWSKKVRQRTSSVLLGHDPKKRRCGGISMAPEESPALDRRARAPLYMAQKDPPGPGSGRWKKSPGSSRNLPRSFRNLIGSFRELPGSF